MAGKPPTLNADGRRLRMIIVSVPIMGATALVLYKRLVLGAPQRKLNPDERMDITKGAVVVQHHSTNEEERT
ncbi:uncharacterized protein STEHIDRAFT_130678 [Stereum hirsutum FP-91666 SS1]|uniref:uncharacterized protein n=1 Tax=Stereum hirsutum (strain FP-91666) TaxID=721885 RepID=UPI000440B459|nr:uncharacterized protein STEHIDRAFT_130678 [Stereum hirsutum FP-91666 SS1]EIM87223.1 hypothetical protein STEHIDRAFT_130678 [Stereum hirsutum FP-91666 SS1]